jgi:hypothetical protein
VGGRIRCSRPSGCVGGVEVRQGGRAVAIAQTSRELAGQATTIFRMWSKGSPTRFQLAY